MNAVNAILTCIGGLGIFLVGLKLLSSNSQSLFYEKLSNLFNRPNMNKPLCVFLGAGASAAVQSSGAISAMSIGLVDCGILSITQSAAIIMGANVGTTITAQLIAFGTLSSGGLNFEILFGTLAGVGAILSLIAKKEKLQKIGLLIAGFGMIFMGLYLMSNSMSHFSTLPSLHIFLAGLKSNILLLLLGIILTAFMQSSSAVTSIIITMLPVGLLNLDQAIMLTFGSNIGSCVTAIIAGFGTNKKAKQASWFNMLFNTLGVIIFLIISNILGIFGISYGSLLSQIFKAPQVALAMMHTIFNVLSLIILYPFTNQILALCKIERKKRREIA